MVSFRDVDTQEVYCFFPLNLLCFLPVFFHHQLIIITGPSYESLASEGIKFNMDGTDLEDITCTVIGGVTYHQVCTSDAKLRIAEDEESMTGLLLSELVLHCLFVIQNEYIVAESLSVFFTFSYSLSEGLSIQLCRV